MKTVLLIRHGKSDWKAGQSDMARPLNTRGIKDSATMARVVKEQCEQPDHFFYSSATRTTQTTELLIKYLKVDQDISVKCPELYLCHSEAIYDLINFAPEQDDCIAIIGHNPSISHVAADLSQEQALYLPTLAILQLSFDTNDWEEVKASNCISRKFFTPKNK